MYKSLKPMATNAIFMTLKSYRYIIFFFMDFFSWTFFSWTFFFFDQHDIGREKNYNGSIFAYNYPSS